MRVYPIVKIPSIAHHIDIRSTFFGWRGRKDRNWPLAPFPSTPSWAGTGGRTACKFNQLPQRPHARPQVLPCKSRLSSGGAACVPGVFSRLLLFSPPLLILLVLSHPSCSFSSFLFFLILLVLSHPPPHIPDEVLRLLLSLVHLLPVLSPRELPLGNSLSESKVSNLNLVRRCLAKK